MKITNKLLKPIKEINYLRSENVARYRVIIRYFFLEYEKINYWLHREDIYKILCSFPEFENYSLELCQQDLQSLVAWGNLIAVQDSSKVKTIQDFQNKQYRYQLSEYSVEIERMTIRLENLEIEGASLEITLIERIYDSLKEFDHIKDYDKIYGWFQALMNDFVRLNQNYQDYVRTLNSAKADELMKTEAFLLYKDKLINYLRTFVKALQETGYLISLFLEKMDPIEIEKMLQKVVQIELSIPRIDNSISEEELFENYVGKWHSFYKWFVNVNGNSEVERLNDITNEIIRKMTRYAHQIIELSNRGSNRKEQYYHIANVFNSCQNIEEAHCLSAYVFGVTTCLHLNYIKSRTSESINQGVYEDKVNYCSFEPHTRIIRKKTTRTPPDDYSFDKKMYQLELEEKIEKSKKDIQAITTNNIIDFSKLPVIKQSTRKTLLLWLCKAIENNNKSKTDDDREYYIDDTFASTYTTLHCEDGDFYMPSFRIIFKEKKDDQ